MADGDVQGLLVRIEATTAQLRQEMARGESAVAATSKNMDNSLARVDEAFDRAGASARGMQGVISSVASTFGAFNIAAVGSVAGLVALAQGAISNAQEIQNLSSVANASVEEFQRMAYGAKSVGVEQDKLGDILKDVNDRVGEFLQRGGGEMADFFKEIAPLVGVTADQFRNLSGPQALQLYYDSLQKAGLNQQQLTTYMEQMADEATALIPLLRDNGKGFKDAGDQAEKLGAVLKEIDHKRLLEAGKAVRELEATFFGVSQQITLGMLPAIESVTQSLSDLRDDGGAQKVGQAIAFLAENVDVLAAAVGGKLTAAFAKYAIDAVASAGVAGKALVDETKAVRESAIAKAEEAVVTAEGTAAKLREAVATAASTKALAADAAARVVNLQAARDSLAYQAALAAGTKEEGQLKASLAAIELELAAARKAATAAANAEANASNSAAAAMARDTAATQANAAAQKEAAAAKGLVARSAAGLMGLMGGPTGLIALAIGVGAAYLTLRDNTSTLEKKLGDLADPLDKLIDRFNKLNKATQAVTLRELQASIDEAQRKLNETSGAIADKFENDLRNVGAAGADGLMAGLAPLPEGVRGALDLVRKAAQDTAGGLQVDWKAVADEVRKVPGVSEQMAQAIEEGQIRASDLGASLQKLKGDLQALTAATRENTVATGENNAVKAGMSATEETYLQALQKRGAALEDGNSETKKATRWLSEQKSVTEEGRKAILDEAAAADKQRAAKEAATKAAQAATSAAKESVTETKNQAKALTDLQAQTKIAIESAGGLAAAYLAGTDKSREFTLQQKVEEALLKTGVGARDAVTASIKKQMDAEDRLAVSKQIFDLKKETDDQTALAKATLQGADALEENNLQKALQVALIDKGLAVGSKEYEQLQARIKAQQEELNLAKRAANAPSIMDRLLPAQKLLNDYIADQNALNAAMKLNSAEAGKYQEALRLLALEYEQNKNAASAWGKFTEGAVDRVDEAFANAWRNIGDGVGGYYAGAAIGSLVGPLGTVIGGVIGSALGSFLGGSLFGGSWQTKDTGLALGVTGGEFTGQQYEYQKKKGGLFGKNKKRTRYSDLDPEVASALQETYDATEDTVVDLLGRIGVSVGDGAFAGLNIAKQQISTKGKSEAEIQEEIAKLFSGFADQMITFIDQGVGGFGYSFAELGERVAVFESFNKSLGLIDVTMLGLSAQSMELANAMVAAAGGLETYTQNLNTYFGAFFSESERADKTIEAVRQQFKDMNVALPETREGYRKVIEALDLTTETGQQMYLALIGAAGAAAEAYDILEARANAAAQAFTDSLGNYLGSFFSAAEKADTALALVQQQFRDMNVTLPETREGYRKIVEALDLTTETGHQMYLTLIGAAGSAAQAYDILEARSAAARENVATAVNAALGSVQRAVNAQKTAITEAYNAQIASLNDMSQTAQQSVSDLTSVGSSLSSALKSLRGDSDDAVKMLRAQAMATLNSALATVRAGKSLAGITGLDDALAVVSQNTTDAYASLEAYNRDQGRTANIVSQLEAANGKQLTTAEKSVQSLQTRIEQAKKSYDLQIAQYDAQLSLAQAQIDALNGVDNSVVSVAVAVEHLSQAVSAALSVKDDGAAKLNTYENNAAIVRAVYRSVLGREAEAGGLANWTGALSGGLLTYDELVQAIATAGKANGETIRIPGFATGGSFGGGIRLVGERGPELEVTGPSRIYNANQTAAMLNGGQGDVTAAEVRELRAELKSALFAIAKYTQKAAKNTDLLPQKLEQELYS
ncbi:TPA: hypothetical protein ACG3DQ_000769 [Pseudomonas putida]